MSERRRTTLVFVSYRGLDDDWEVVESAGYYQHKTQGTFELKEDAVEKAKEHANSISEGDFFDEVYLKIENKDGETIENRSYT